jgi:hypothetical protein
VPRGSRLCPPIHVIGLIRPIYLICRYLLFAFATYEPASLFSARRV